MSDSHQREKLLLLDEVDQLKREKDLLDRSLANKDVEILEIHKQCETASSTARNADNKIRLLESQVTSAQRLLMLKLLQYLSGTSLFLVSSGLPSRILTCTELSYPGAALRGGTGGFSPPVGMASPPPSWNLGVFVGDRQIEK